MFIGRDRELATLAELHDSGRPELFVLWGRRRVGKTELLQRFCHERRAVYFLAAQVRDRDNLRAFRRTAAEALGDELLQKVDFPDWGAALGFLAERAGAARLVVVLDEFPYLCEANKGLPSELQRFWDTVGKRSGLMLVLCGSAVSFMEREVLAERSPLFGRRTGQRRLEPIAPLDALGFFERWSLADRVRTLGILGGMPAYLQRFDDALDLRENVLREMLRPEGYLFEEVSFLLRSEVSNPATYASLLAALARGAERLNDIALEVGVDSTTAGKYLHVLRELRLVEREVPLSDPHPLRSRRGTYRVADRFLQFHYRHLQAHRSLVQAGRGAQVWERFVEPDLPRLAAEALGDLVLDHLQRFAATIVGDEIVETGRHGGRAVRALARTSEGEMLAAVTGAAGAAEGEIGALAALFGRPVRRIDYALTDDPAAPLRVTLSAASRAR